MGFIDNYRVNAGLLITAVQSEIQVKMGHALASCLLGIQLTGGIGFLAQKSLLLLPAV